MLISSDRNIFDFKKNGSGQNNCCSNHKNQNQQIPKDVVEWVYEENMTDEEKAAHPTYETTGGYLKVLDESECGQLWWGSLSDRRKEIIKAIPNFDAEIFFQCTGVRVDE